MIDIVQSMGFFVGCLTLIIGWRGKNGNQGRGASAFNLMSVPYRVHFYLFRHLTLGLRTALGYWEEAHYTIINFLEEAFFGEVFTTSCVPTKA